ncbi:hypothetical protein D9615_004644 [Tricholomella constricta]|uniref:Uncharacterized protein n=1 Tax=Tricholomella constricta TaxID=117010 RepID=A0A8H5M4I7_9AGAR|nr:hypothetical protein D9615_004644 [Tricholomella constricta]
MSNNYAVNQPSSGEGTGSGPSTLSSFENVGTGDTRLGNRINFVSSAADKLESFVTKFREGNVSKADCILEGHDFIGTIEGSTAEAKKFAFREFVSTVDSVGALNESAQVRGERAQVGLDGSRPVPEHQ